MSCLLTFLLSGCTDNITETETTEVKTTFRLSTSSALQGKISIQEAYLKLDHIEASGMLAGQRLATISHEMPREELPFKLSRPDSSYITFGMPVTPYDQISYDIYLYQDTYQLILADAGPEIPSPTPPPSNNGDGDVNDNDEEPNEIPAPGNDTGGDESEENDGGESPSKDDDDKDNNDEDHGDDDDHDKDGEDDRDEDDDNDRDEDDDNDHDEDGKKNKGKGKKKDKDNKGKKGGKDEGDDDKDGSRLTGTSNAFVDLDHFFQNAKPSLVVVGTYNNNAQRLTIIFVVSGKDKLTLQTAGNENIVVTTHNLAEVVLDPEQWFVRLTTADIESGQRQTYQGQEVLFIHKDVNPGLYERLAAQLESSARLTFNTMPAP